MICVVFHLIAALFSEGMHHWDEHFQILEFINLKKGGITGNELPWEYSAKMRPWIMPGFYYLIDFANPFIMTTIYRLISALLGLGALYSTYKLFKRNYLLIALCSLWFFPYIHARISAEAVGASLFMIALIARPALFRGLLMGIAFYCRFHIGILILFYHLYQLIFKKEKLSTLMVSTLGILIAIAFNVLIDYWGYGEWVFTPWEYVRQNLLENKVSSFGVNPWYDYFKMVFNKSFAPLGILIILSHLYLWIKHPKNILTWLTLPFFLIHCLIGHKELRFLFPLVHFVPVILVLFLEELKLFKYQKMLKFIFILNLFLLPIYSFTSAHPITSFFKKTNITSGDTLSIYGDTDPYHLAQLPVRYYSSEVPKINKLRDDSMVPLDSYVFSNRGKFYLKIKENPSCKLIYSSYPEWVLNINIANWQKRSKAWTLFHCKN